jgi:hypothetical protein
MGRRANIKKKPLGIAPLTKNGVIRGALEAIAKGLIQSLAN